MRYNRDIKFRAWDKRTRKMIETGFHILGEVTCFDLIEDYCMKHMRKDEVSLLRMNSVVIMQWTGLKDKNGKDIYEDDIVKYTAHITEGTESREEEIIAPIEFELGAFIANPPNSNYDTELGMAPLWMEVIGNIYENKDLLK